MKHRQNGEDIGQRAQAAAKGSTAKVFGSYDGVDFTFVKRAGGVFMPQGNRDARQAFVEHSILFSSVGDVTSWLDEDPVVRTRPLLRVRLKQVALELL